MGKKIGIISDTHIGRENTHDLPEWICEAFKGVDMILHAGDITNPDLLDELASIAPVLAVKGNMDEWRPEFPAFRYIPLEEGTAVMAHQIQDAMQRVADDVLLVIHGHSHTPKILRDGNLLIVNPGSPTRPRDGNPPSVMVIDVAGKNLNPVFKYPPNTADK